MTPFGAAARSGAPTLHLCRVDVTHDPLATSRGVHSGRPSLLLGLEGIGAAAARQVWAEACPLPGFGAADDLALAQSELASLDGGTVGAWLEQPGFSALDRVFADTRTLRSGAARHAAEWLGIQALAHLSSTGPAELVLAWLRHHSSPAAWPGPRQVLDASAVLDLLDPELTRRATLLHGRGVVTWKLKCGRDAEGEQRALRALGGLGLPAFVRLDPGAAWTLPEAIELIRGARLACESSRLVLEYVEDPTPTPGEWGPLAELAPLAADEVLSADGAPAKLEHAATWVLKPMVLGIGRLLDLALLGKRQGRRLVVSHAFDGPLALSAAFELACAVQTPALAAGLGDHAALPPWQALDPSSAEILRGAPPSQSQLRQQVLVDGGHLGRVLGQGTLSLARAAACYGDRPFLDFGVETISFAELPARTRAVSLPEGVPFHPVLAEPTWAAVGELLAALDRGTIALLLHPSVPAADREALVQRCEVHAAELGAEDALIVPTSGSTGEPHLVVHTRRSLLAAVSASAPRLGGPTESSRWLLSLPFAHVGGLSILLRCLAAGACVVVGPLPKDPEAAARFLAERRVTHLSLVPTQLHRLLESPRFTLPTTVECVLLGGAEASQALRHLAAARGIPICCTYGLTEMGSQVATEVPGRPRSRDAAELASVGGALPGAALALDEDGRLRVGGPMLMRGYLGEPSPIEDGLFRTGDLGQLTPSGELVVLGRMDDIIITGGENVAPGLVERALLTASGVRQACAVGLPSETWGREIVAAVVPEGGARSDALLAERLAAAAHALLPAFARPKRYRFLAELPTLASGKVDRAALSFLLAREEELKTK